jgi:hypothetical protein
MMNPRGNATLRSPDRFDIGRAGPNGLLWVPFYNFTEPSLFGFPFFYWYQLAWVPISSFLIWLVYRSRTPDETP